MKVQGDYTFSAPRPLVWRALLDPVVLARVLPGCERLERVGENEFRGLLKVQVGPVKGEFEGSLQLADLRPLEGYHLKLAGSGNAGFMNGEGELRLEDAGGGTRLAYDLDAQVGGRIAGVGQRLLESSSKVIARQGLEGLDRELQALQAAEGTGGGGAASGTDLPSPARHPSQATQAARFAGGVLGELVPAERRAWAIGAAALAAALLAVLLLRACG